MQLQHLTMLIVMRYSEASNKEPRLDLPLVLIQSPLVAFQDLQDAEALVFPNDGIRNQYLAPLMLQI